MRLKLVMFIVILGYLLLIGVAWYLIKKYYMSYNLLRLDPLEQNSINKDLLATKNNDAAIWLIGDSRIARWDKSLWSPYEGNIINLGIEGQTSSQVLNRAKNHLEIGNPAWVVLEVGINDLKIIGINEVLTNKIVEDCVKNICSIIDLCRNKNINVILIDIFPTGDIELLRRLIWNNSVDSAITLVNEKLSDFCSDNNIIFFETGDILCTDNQKIKEQFQDGFLHINREAYAILCREIIEKYGAKINSSLKIKTNLSE